MRRNRTCSECGPSQHRRTAGRGGLALQSQTPSCLRLTNQTAFLSQYPGARLRTASLALGSQLSCADLCRPKRCSEHWPNGTHLTFRSVGSYGGNGPHAERVCPAAGKLRPQKPASRTMVAARLIGLARRRLAPLRGSDARSRRARPLLRALPRGDGRTSSRERRHGVGEFISDQREPSFLLGAVEIRERASLDLEQNGFVGLIHRISAEV